MSDTINKFSADEIEKKAAGLEGWSVSDDQKAITKEFKFKNYWKTINFVNVMAWHAQELRHHPDLEVNYGRVFVKLTTHDVDGLSALDFELASRIEQLNP